MRAQYEDLIAHPQRLEEILHAGAAKARAHATPLLATVRQAAGLRPLVAVAAPAAARNTAATRSASFKQYREADGLFYFKLNSAEGQTLLQSGGFASPKDAAALIARLKTQGWPAYQAEVTRFDPVDETSHSALQNVLSQLQKDSEAASNAAPDSATTR